MHGFQLLLPLLSHTAFGFGFNVVLFLIFFYFLLLIFFPGSSASSNFCTGCMEGRGGGSPLGSGAGCSPRRQHAPRSALGVTQVRAFGRAASRTSQRFSPHFCESLFYTPAPIAMMVGRGNPCLCALDKQEQVKHPCEGGLCPCRYSCIQELCPQRALDPLPACAGGGCSPLGFPSGTGLPTQLLCPAGHSAAGGVRWAGSCCQSSTGVCMWQWGGLDSGPAAPARSSPRLPPSLLPPPGPWMCRGEQGWRQLL